MLNWCNMLFTAQLAHWNYYEFRVKTLSHNAFNENHLDIYDAILTRCMFEGNVYTVYVLGIIIQEPFNAFPMLFISQVQTWFTPGHIDSIHAWKWSYINTLRPRQNGRHSPDNICKCIFLNENVWISIKISLNFVPRGPINNIPTLVQIMAWRRPGHKP